MSPHYLGEHGPSWGWLGPRRKQESVLSLRFILPEGAAQIGSGGSGNPRKVHSELRICIFFSGKESQSFHRILQSVYDSPTIKSCLHSGP